MAANEKTAAQTFNILRHELLTMLAAHIFPSSHRCPKDTTLPPLPELLPEKVAAPIGRGIGSREHAESDEVGEADLIAVIGSKEAAGRQVVVA